MDLMYEAIMTHMYTVYVFLAIMIFNLYSVLTVKDFVKLAKRLKFMTPLFHLCVAVMMYTGAIVATYAKVFSWTIALMIPTAIFLMILEIKRNKKMKVIKSTDIQLQKEFVIYAKKIYIIEISVLLTVFVITKLF